MGFEEKKNFYKKIIKNSFRKFQLRFVVVVVRLM